MDKFEDTRKLFQELNSVSSVGGAVFLSTGRLAELPITELAWTIIYNLLGTWLLNRSDVY